MSIPSRSNQALRLVTYLYIAVGGASACSDLDIAESPPPAPDNRDRRRCVTGRNDAWKVGQIGIDLPTFDPATDSVRLSCPYTVEASGNDVAMLFRIEREPRAIFFGCADQLLRWHVPAGLAIREERNLPIVNFTCRSTLLPTGQVRTSAVVENPFVFAGGLSDGGRRVLDSVFARYTTSSLADAVAGASVPGNVGANVNGIIRYINPTVPRIDRPTIFSPLAEHDTNSYQHQWHVNGSIVAGARGRRFTYIFADDSPVTIADVLTRADGTSFMLTSIYQAHFTTTVLGSSALTVSEYGAWYIADPGGRAPLTYTWTLDGVPVGSDTGFGTTFWSAGTHIIGVTVTDALARTATSALAVTVSECGNTGCGPSLRNRSRSREVSIRPEPK